MPSVTSFVEDLDQSLVDETPVRQHLLKVVLARCGRRKRSDALLAELTAALQARGIHARPRLNESGIGLDTRIEFSRRPVTIWETGLTFPDEKSLEDVIYQHYRRIPALSHLRSPRRQVRLPSGRRIDLLFEEMGTNALVVAELKVSTGGRITGPQVIDYICEFRTTPPARGREVHGLLVTGEPNTRLERQVKALAEEAGVRVQWLCYRLNVEVGTVFEFDGRRPTSAAQRQEDAG